jgi:hypothetical protein
MLAEQRVGGAVGMRPVARPAIGARVIDHPGDFPKAHAQAAMIQAPSDAPKLKR